MRKRLMAKIWYRVHVSLCYSATSYRFVEGTIGHGQYFFVGGGYLIDMWFILKNAKHQSKNAGSIWEVFKEKSARVPLYCGQEPGFPVPISVKQTNQLAIKCPNFWCLFSLFWRLEPASGDGQHPHKHHMISFEMPWSCLILIVVSKLYSLKYSNNG